MNTKRTFFTFLVLLAVSGCSTTTMTVTSIGNDGIRETKHYSKYYSSGDWVVEGRVGIEVWLDHDKKVGPLYPLQRSMGMLGPGDMHASGIVTCYFVNLEESPKQVSDFRIVYGRSSQKLELESGFELGARSVTRAVPGKIPISNYGTAVKLRAEFVIDGVKHSIPLTASRLTDKELVDVRSSFPWFRAPYYPFEPPLSRNF